MVLSQLMFYRSRGMPLKLYVALTPSQSVNCSQCLSVPLLRSFSYTWLAHWLADDMHQDDHKLIQQISNGFVQEVRAANNRSQSLLANHMLQKFLCRKILLLLMHHFSWLVWLLPILLSNQRPQ